MIHVQGLTKYYQSFCAVDNISFDIKKGEIIGLLGPNGAGKTTTLRMLTGYFQPSSGDIDIKGQSVSENKLGVKKLIGYLPESAPIYQDMLVYDYLNYVAEIHGLTKDTKLSRLRQLSDLCGLSNIMHKTVGELSKGLKQRVGLAHAMMSDPEILILDEPTSGLDPNQIVEIRKIIKEIGKEKTIILSTHILSEAEATCDRIIIINQGKIVADGTTDSIKNSSEGENTITISLKNADFESTKNEIKQIAGISDIINLNSDEKDLLKISIICNGQTDLRENVYSTIKNNDWVLLEMYQESNTLETIFRNLTMES